MPLLMLLHFQFFRWNMLHLSRNTVLIFILVLTAKKRYPFIFLHISLYLSYKISNHLLNTLELEYASFSYCSKWSPKMFVVKK